MPASIHLVGRGAVILWIAAALSSRPTAAASSSAPRREPEQLNLAIVNSVTFHLEILLGVLFVLEKIPARKTVFVHNATMPGGRFNYAFEELLGAQYRGRLRAMPNLYPGPGRTSAVLEPQDVVLFVSPEYNWMYVKRFADASRPRHVIAIVHHADVNDAGRLGRLCPGSTHLLTLSPHVRDSLKRLKGYDADWILPTPVLTLDSETQDDSGSGNDTGGSGNSTGGGGRGRGAGWGSAWPASQDAYGGPPLAAGAVAAVEAAEAGAAAAAPPPPGMADIQWSGFAVQGGLSARRRNYGGLLQDIDARYHAVQLLREDPRFRIHVVGSGSLNISAIILNATAGGGSGAGAGGKGVGSAPGSPPDLAALWTIHSKLKFLDFYRLLHHMLALLPLFGSNDYIEIAFSSTFATMLITGAPILATDRILEAYSFLPPEAVFHQAHKAHVVDALVMVLRKPPAEVARTRAAVRDLQRSLNVRARRILWDLIYAP